VAVVVTRSGLLLLAALMLASAPAGAPPAEGDPFAFLSPGIRIEPKDRARLDAGEPLVQVLPARDGHIALLAAIRIDVTTQRFLAWSGEVERLQKGRYVPEIARFSHQPCAADLATLTLDASDADDLRACRPGRCGLKLHASEIERVQRTLVGQSWRQAAPGAMRDVILQRAIDYLARGDAGALPYQDRRKEVAPAAAFGRVLARVPFLPVRFGGVSRYLLDFPEVDDPNIVDTRLYWSKENLGVKPIISITHYVAARFSDPRLPEAIVVAKQVFATHYKEGSMSVTALAGRGDARYLVYLHRSQLDTLEGLFGGLTRMVVERRVRGEAPGVLRGLKMRLERDVPSPTY
jgi:hypothetical protein